MYGGKNTLIRASVDRREACSPDVTLSKNLFFDSFRNGGFIMIYTGIEQLVGHTPLYCPERLLKGKRLYGNVLCKLEMFNPAGSVKDRAGLYMILDAEEKGLLAPGGTIIEPTSGNTGIGLAAAAAARGYKVILTMPDSMSAERRAMLRAYGAELVLTPGAEGMAGAVQKAEALHAAAPGSIIAGQFENPANAKAHYETTGPEIWDDTGGKVDLFVAGIGTGGTITGTGRYLKEKRPSIRVIGVEPAASPLLTEGKAGPHGLQGIGANFVPELLDRGLLDGVIPVADEDAFRTAKALVRAEGLLCGITSGAALWAAVQLASKPENAGKTIVALLPDNGDRYLSAGVYD